MLSSLFKPLLEFLYPRNPKVLQLESLSAEKLLAILPPVEPLNTKDTLALFNYQDPLVKEIVWEIKYKGNRVLAERLGTILYDIIESELAERNVYEKFQSVVLMPMPISDKRRFERGWNQAELLCNVVKALDIAQKMKYLPRQLAKIRHTESQTRTATKKERLENLQDSMRVLNPSAVEGRFVVLVDDVTTTGSTFAEAKRALKAAGVRRSLCIAIAH